MKPARDTTTHSKDEVVRRFSYILYVASAIGGAALLIAAAVNRSFTYAALAAAVIVLNLTLHHFGRRRLRFGEFKDEFRRNPFKATKTTDREDDEKAG